MIDSALSGEESLVRLAAMIADGESVDWEAETERTPELAREIDNLRWLEAVTIARRIGAREATGPSKSPRGDAPPQAAAPAKTGDAAPVQAQAEPPAEPLSPGIMWGRLKIIERIGKGAGGDVYRAFDPALEREVALKIWRERGGYRTTGTEARRLGRIKHPGVLQVLGNERHDGYAGMWTDFLDGKSLEEVLAERGTLAASEACRVGIALCDALEAVHAAGMVHRDLKAANVMWLADESVVLIDFGSVKELPRGVPEGTERMRGTPLATAPELLRGEPIGPAADIYSLGVLLYRLVSGRYPVEAKSLAELIEYVERRTFQPLAERRPDCDPVFARVVDRALSRAPAKRPGIAEIRRELANVPAGGERGG
jgi:hypothetical protein